MNGSIVKRWLYQDQLTPAAEVDSVGNVITRFAPGYITKGDSTYALITDHLGSVKIVVNVATGIVRQRMEYDEFGNVVLNTNPDFQPFGYAGGLYDDATKLVRFGARDYSAKEGRWTVIDPILFKGGTSNLYEYCVNDPINNVDANGLQYITVKDAAIAAMNGLRKKTNLTKMEYGGWIVKGSDGKYYYLSEVMGHRTENGNEITPGDLGTKPSNAYGLYHTHTFLNDFSDKDINASKHFGVPLFVNTPDEGNLGYFFKWHPFNDSERLGIYRIFPSDDKKNKSRRFHPNPKKNCK